MRRLSVLLFLFCVSRGLQTWCLRLREAESVRESGTELRYLILRGRREQDSGETKN